MSLISCAIYHRNGLSGPTCVSAGILKSIGGFVSGLDRVGKSFCPAGMCFCKTISSNEGLFLFLSSRDCRKPLRAGCRLRKPWFIRRYYWQGVSDAAMQIVRDSHRRLNAGFRRFIGSDPVAIPRDLINLLLPTNVPAGLRKNVSRWIAVGHVLGLLGAAGR